MIHQVIRGVSRDMAAGPAVQFDGPLVESCDGALRGIRILEIQTHPTVPRGAC
jgi:hypothetical protein